MARLHARGSFPVLTLRRTETLPDCRTVHWYTVRSDRVILSRTTVYRPNARTLSNPWRYYARLRPDLPFSAFRDLYTTRGWTVALDRTMSYESAG